MNTNIVKKRPTLDEVLAYENNKIIDNFIKSFGVSKEESVDIFNQVKRMLWLTNEMEFDGLKKEQKKFSIDASLLVIDEMWHTFILFTTDYQDFCMNTFGYFIHHFPNAETEAEKAQRTAEFDGLGHDEQIAKVMDEKRWQYAYVFKKLGKESFLKWYTTFHNQYTPQYLAELRLKMASAKHDVSVPTPP